MRRERVYRDKFIKNRNNVLKSVGFDIAEKEGFNVNYRRVDVS